ncbi:MAG TPA: nitrilase-related carbon-nitrogen hydrolase [Polyangia bacterium]|nr:nitrilase-related carbon-nitrogen hydrolase [Polyangia bacterium]
MSILRVAGLQLDVSWEDRAANFEKARRLGLRARDEGAGLVVLPEMFATGFSLDPAVTAEAPDGETPSFIKGLARELGIAVVGGYVQKRRGGKGANLALAVDGRGAVLAEYAKTHLFTFTDEQLVHEAGAGPRSFVFDGIEASCFICYDLRFPELFRLVAGETKLVLVIASWGAARQRQWDVFLPARAAENQLYVVGVNRVGSGGGVDYTGGSAAYDPLGRQLCHGGDQEGLIFADIDPDAVIDVRAAMPFLKDRRF